MESEDNERKELERKAEEKKDRKIKEVREAWERRKKEEDEEWERKRQQKEKGQQLKEDSKEEEKTTAEKQGQEEEETNGSISKAPEEEEKHLCKGEEDAAVKVEDRVAPTVKAEEAVPEEKKIPEAGATNIEKIAPGIAWSQWFFLRRRRAIEAKKSQVGAASPEMVERKVTSLLNKLTTKNFDPLSDKIIWWANKSEKEKDGRTLIQVIRLIFARAIDEAAWSEMYARLCRKMMERLSPQVQDDGIRNAVGKPIGGGQLFRKYLLNRCQEDFERGWFSKETTSAVAPNMVAQGEEAKEAKESTPDADHDKAELYSSEYYAAQKARRRGLGLVKFIGELFRLQMLTERIMHECIKKLLVNANNPEEEEMESLCTLLITVGAILDTNRKARAHMDIYFTRMTGLSKSPKVSPRVQFILQDVIELRERKWIPRNDDGEPNAIGAARKQLDIPGVAYSRRPSSLSAPPITIYHPVFTKFLSIMNITPEKIEFSNEELDSALDLMAAVAAAEILPQVDREKSRLLFNRRRAAFSSLEKALRMGTRQWNTTLLEGEGSVPLHSHSRIPCPLLPGSSFGLGVTIVVSNKVSNNGSDALTYAKREYVAAMAPEEYRIVRDVSCCPALLIGLAGEYLTVSGSIFTDRHISRRLTPDYIYIGPRPDASGRSALDQGAQKIAQVLRAIREALENLDEFYRSLASPSGPPTSGGPSTWSLHRESFSPHFQTYSDGKEVFRLRYLEQLASNDPETAVFKARSEGLTSKTESTVVVKFTHNYGEEGHKLLESISLAPPLRFCQRVEDVGMLVVIMGFAEGEGVENRVRGASRIQSLRNTLRALHEKDLVFGDLRAENVLVRQSDEGLILIDFDWCGRAGVARYPHHIDLDTDIGWHADVRRGGRIEKEHDAYLFQALTGEPL